MICSGNYLSTHSFKFRWEYLSEKPKGICFFVASKIKVLKVQTAEATIPVKIYQIPSSKLQGPLAKCT
jgi:hypothetical protein